MTTKQIEYGDKVKCLSGNIRDNIGKGEIGYVTGFARFSQYHGREVFVSDKPAGDYSTANWAGWFWLSDVELKTFDIQEDFFYAAQSGFSHPTVVHQDWIVYGANCRIGG